MQSRRALQAYEPRELLILYVVHVPQLLLFGKCEPYLTDIITGQLFTIDERTHKRQR